MAEENISQEVTLKNIDEKRNYFVEEIEQNEWMSNLSLYGYMMHFHFCFCFLVGIPIGITSSAIGLKICAIAKLKRISQ